MTPPTVVAWITEGTWQATVDATARAAAGLEPVEVVLLHVVDARITEALHGAFGGLLGRGARDRRFAAQEPREDRLARRRPLSSCCQHDRARGSSSPVGRAAEGSSANRA